MGELCAARLEGINLSGPSIAGSTVFSLDLAIQGYVARGLLYEECVCSGVRYCKYAIRWGREENLR